MAINMEQQFHKLRGQVLRINKFIWGGGDEYLGPINPSAIVNMTILRFNKSVNYLVLAENVPAKYIPWDPAHFPTGVVLAQLDDQFELEGFDYNSNIIKKIQGCLCSDGTMNGINNDNPDHVFYFVVYKPLSMVNTFNKNFKGGRTMSRRLEDLVDLGDSTQPHVATVLLLDTSGSMDGEKIRSLNEGLKTFKEDIEQDELAAKRVDLAVITFDDSVQINHNFSSIEGFDPPSLTAGGYTTMGDAILKAAEMIEERKQQYKQKGIDFYRPWIFMITDGEPTDMQPGDSKWNEVIKVVHNGEANKKFMFFGVAVEPGLAR